MDPSQENPREYLRQAIDAEIKSLEESIRALRHRRNTLAPISRLPIEVIATIFSFLRLPGTSPLDEEPDLHLARLRVAHVCHQWREIALNLPLFWNHIDFAAFSPAGVTEMLARARMVPLYLEAMVPSGHWDGARFSAFQKQLQAHTSHICHLAISAENSHLRKTLEGLVLPAPTLEYLSLSSESHKHGTIQLRVIVPDTIFGGSTPRLSCLELRNCDIDWKSSPFKGLKHLEIREPYPSGRPSLSIWLDALDEMPHLRTLTLHSASPISPGTPLPSDIERTVTLPSLMHLDISAFAADCGIALAHLILPSLTQLFLMARSWRWGGGDVQEILPYVARHAHGPQDPHPLRTMSFHTERTRADFVAWTAPDISVLLHSRIDFHGARPSPRVAFSYTNEDWSPETHLGVFGAVMVALPLENLVTLSAQNCTRSEVQFWPRHVPRWPLLKCVCLAPTTARGFVEMMLQDGGERENRLLPSLTKLVLVDTALSARRTLHLCDALMKRAEQGVPLEILDLRTCPASSRAVQLLSEIVVDVWGPGPEERPPSSTWDSKARGFFVPDDNSGIGDYDRGDSFTGGDEWVDSEIDEDEADYW